MATLIGLFTLGRDAELRSTSGGDQVATMAVAYNYGRKGQDGKQPTQWIDGSIFGKRAEVLGPMLLKGAQHVFHLSDLHIETFQGKNGEGHKLVGRVDDVELTDRRDGVAPQQAQRPTPQPAPRQAPARQASSGFDDMYDDIPF